MKCEMQLKEVWDDAENLKLMRSIQLRGRGFIYERDDIRLRLFRKQEVMGSMYVSLCIYVVKTYMFIYLHFI